MVGIYLPFLRAWLEERLGNERGQGAVEYAVIVAVVAVVVAGMAIGPLNTALTNAYTAMEGKVTGAIGGI